MKRENTQKNKVRIFAGVLFIVILLSISSISALNAKIGNGKVELYAKVGDVIEKSVKVINDNNVTVNIELIGDGDLKDQIKFKKANFTLAPKEEMDAGYSLKIIKEGKTTSYVNVKFTAVGEKNGIILPASVIIFAQKNNGTTTDNNGLFDWFKPANNTNDNNSTDGGVNNPTKLSLFAIGLVVTAIIFVILLVVLYIYSKNQNNSFNKLTKTKEFSVYPTPNNDNKNKGIGYKRDNVNQKKKEK